MKVDSTTQTYNQLPLSGRKSANRPLPQFAGRDSVRFGIPPEAAQATKAQETTDANASQTAQNQSKQPKDGNWFTNSVKSGWNACVNKPWKNFSWAALHGIAGIITLPILPLGLTLLGLSGAHLIGGIVQLFKKNPAKPTPTENTDGEQKTEPANAANAEQTAQASAVQTDNAEQAQPASPPESPMDAVQGLSAADLARLNADFIEPAKQGKAVAPLLIHGPEGSGKSFLAQQAAKATGKEVIELNRSTLQSYVGSQEKLTELANGLNDADPQTIIIPNIDHYVTPPNKPLNNISAEDQMGAILQAAFEQNLIHPSKTIVATVSNDKVLPTNAIPWLPTPTKLQTSKPDQNTMVAFVEQNLNPAARPKLAQGREKKDGDNLISFLAGQAKGNSYQQLAKIVQDINTRAENPGIPQISKTDIQSIVKNA